MELFVEIRRGSKMEGLSVRALAKKHGVHRRMVRQALISPQPPELVTRRWRARKIDLFVDAIDDMLRSDLDAPRKQRHTTTRIFNRLIDEHDAAGLVSYSTLRTYVVARRQKISQEAGNAPIAQVFVPQSHLPGDEAEVDFAELFVGSSKLRGNDLHPVAASRWRRVQAHRTRRRWLSRFLNPNATRATSLIK